MIDQNSENNKETKKLVENVQSQVSAINVDIRDRAALKDAAEQSMKQFGDAAILVNNAGVLLRGKVDDPNMTELWDTTIETNLTGTFNVTNAFLEQLKKTKGVIVNVGSIHSEVAVMNSIAYTASKGGIAQLTKALALELSEFNIRVNAVAPGIIATNMTTNLRSQEKQLQSFLKRVPLRKVGKPHDVANAVLFLSSSLSAYITGITLPVDGGYLAN